MPSIAPTDKSVPWYQTELPKPLPKPIRDLLEGYAHIPPSEVESHILEVRDKAWAVHPYPCIGLVRFLTLGIPLTPSYASILSRLSSPTHPETLLDLGCCFGAELRALAAAGAPTENLIGADLHADFIECGFDLFRDRDTFKGRFITADILDDAPWAPIIGAVDMIWAGSFFHLFGWDGQVAVCKKVINLLRARKGSVVFGRQAGNVNPGEVEHKANEGGKMYRHDAASWEKLWAEVGAQTGTKWNVKARLEEIEEGGEGKGGAWKGDGGARVLLFAVHREE